MCLHLVPSIHIRVLISFYKDTSHIVAAVYWIRANPNFGVSLVAQIIKKMPAMWETWVRSLSWEGSLEEDVATHSGILVWRIPMDRGAWWVPVHGVTKSWTRLRD